MNPHWWLAPIGALGLVLLAAPALGVWLARRDVWSHCPACGRELIGDPPEHRLSDRAHCAEVIAWQATQRARSRTWRPW